MFSIVSGVFLTSRMSFALDFSCAGCLQSAPSSSVHSPQMSHKSTLRMRTNPCQVYSTLLFGEHFFGEYFLVKTLGENFLGENFWVKIFWGLKFFG